MPLLAYLLTFFGISGLFFWLLLDLLVLHQERGEKLAGWLATLFAWSSEKVEKVSVAKTIQGKIDTFVSDINSEISGLLPYGLKIKWVPPDLTKETFIQEGRVVVLLSYHQNQDENLSRASLMYMSSAVIPESRPHISRKLGMAIDLMMAKKALYSFFEARSSFSHFVQSVLRPEIERDSDIGEICGIIEGIDEKGLFTRVMLRELLELGYKKAAVTESGDTVFESGNFVRFLGTIASKQPGEDVPLSFINRNIKMSIILVARHDAESPDILNPDRFIQRIKFNIRQSSEIIYIFARGSRDGALAEKVIQACRELPELQEIHKGNFISRESGRDVKATCAIFHTRNLTPVAQVP